MSLASEFCGEEKTVVTIAMLDTLQMSLLMRNWKLVMFISVRLWPSTLSYLQNIQWWLSISTSIAKAQGSSVSLPQCHSEAQCSVYLSTLKVTWSRQLMMTCVFDLVEGYFEFWNKFWTMSSIAQKQSKWEFQGRKAKRYLTWITILTHKSMYYS